MSDGKLLLTERETAERLSIGRSTLRKLMAQGAIRAVHIGRAVRFPASEISQYAERLLAGAPQGRTPTGGDHDRGRG